MSRATIERDLFSLLPSITIGLPPDLVQLATSLLAQSRSVAATLKQEEEIARAYACANIACERLKTRLDLPDIKPRPPCPQRLYRKVYDYLNTQLALSRTPSKRSYGELASGPTTPSKRAALNGSSTPTPSQKKQLTNPEVTPRGSRIAIVKATPKAKDGASSFTSTLIGNSTDELPDWLMHFIRSLSALASRPDLAPHIYTGCASLSRQNLPLLQSAASRRESARSKAQAGVILEDQLPALATALLILATATSPNDIDEMDLDEAEQQETKDEAVADTLTEQAFNSLAETTPLDLSAKQFTQQVSMFRTRAEEESWMELEFFTNMRQVTQTNDLDSSMDATRAENDSDEASETEGTFSQRGGGEMAMYTIDWLSEKRKKEYQIWEKGIRERIKRRRS